MQAEQLHRRWKRELEQAKKRDEPWIKAAKSLYARYRGGEKKRNSFNLLWSNTEILRPSVYNSTPKPDVRRRFRDSDPVGKAVSEVLERSLQVAVEHEGFDSGTRFDVLDSLIVGRGLSRVRYVPSFAQGDVIPGANGQYDEQNEQDDEPTRDAGTEELDFEQVVFEHVDWQDFRHGYGRVWAEVQWIAFRCKLDRAEVIERFGEEVANAITFDQTMDDGKTRDDNSQAERVSEFWEVWDKAKPRVFFVHENVERLLYPVANPDGAPPLTLRGFFPIPEPLRMVEDSSSLTPIPLFTLYAEQADEVDRLSARINKIVSALKVRGVYDATLSEIGDLMNGEDNDLIPVSKAAAWKENGGFDKAIWWMPIEQAAIVLQQLYSAREAAKQTIYEITGISDIVRGASNSSETATAQQIKSQFASVRLDRMRGEAARYVRDLLRIGAEIIAEKFQPETLVAMTGLSFPTAEQKMMAQGDPAMAVMPTMDDVLAVLRSDGMRQFRVDIETSSTVASSVESDMSGLREVLSGLIEFWTGSGPAVQAGALPIEAVKSISLAIVRRAKLGIAVEDAVEQMKAPEPQADPNEGQAQADAQAAMQQAQMDQQMAQAKMQADQQMQVAKYQFDQQMAQAKQALEQSRFELEQMKADAEATLARDRMDQEMALKREEMMYRLEIEREQMGKDAAREVVERESVAAAPVQQQPPITMVFSGDKATGDDGNSEAVAAALVAVTAAMAQVQRSVSADRSVERDAAGQIVRVRTDLN